MPVTVPRVSVTEAADDLKARDALLRRFPEVEMIVGKAGRADTPTDPSPLDMVESVITLRPKEYWPRRKLQVPGRRAADGRGAGGPPGARADRADRRRDQTRQAMLDAATMNAADAIRRGHARVGRSSGSASSRRSSGRSCSASSSPSWSGRWQQGRPAARAGERGRHRRALPRRLEKEFAPILAAGPAQEDVNRLIQQIAEKLAAEKKVELDPELLTARFQPALRRLPGRDERAGQSSGPRCSRRCSTSSRSGATRTGGSRAGSWTTKSSTAPWAPTTGTPSRNSQSGRRTRALGGSIPSPSGRGLG